VALRDQEIRQLAEIERGLTEGDPRFAATVRKLNARRPRVPRAVRNALVLLATYLVGLTTVIAGTWWSSVVLLALGAVITAAMPVLVGWRACRTWRQERAG
jgi:heme A synthase